MIKEITSYQTSDGKTFPDRKAAESHEEFINSEIAYRVDYGSGLKTYRFLYLKKLKTAIDFHDMIIEDWCHNYFGDKVSMLNGIPVKNWEITKLSTTPDKDIFKSFILDEL